MNATHQPAKLLRDGVGLIAAVYLALLALLLLAGWILPRYAELTRTFVVVLLFLSLLLVPLCLLAHRWWTTLLLLLPVAALAWTYGPRLLSPREPPKLDTALSLLTFNIQAETRDLEPLVEIIRDTDADVVALQELSKEAAEHFDAALADTYPYRALHPQTDNHAGQGILSRYPISEDTYWRNEDIEASLGHQRVELDVNEQPLVVFNTHPVPPFAFERGWNFDAHRREIEIVLARATDETAPTVLVGDFNMTDQFDEYELITTNYGDAFDDAGAGLGFTYPQGRRLPLPPTVRLDYVFYNEGLQPLEAHVGRRSGSSDHKPLYVRLGFTP